MKIKASLFAALIFTAFVTCHPIKTSEENQLVTTNQITILLHDGVNPKELVKKIPNLIIKSRTNRTLNEWLMEYSGPADKREEILEQLKSSNYVARLDINN